MEGLESSERGKIRSNREISPGSGRYGWIAGRMDQNEGEYTKVCGEEERFGRKSPESGKKSEIYGGWRDRKDQEQV